MNVLKGIRSRSCEDVKTVVLHWFQQQPRKFFIEGIYWLVSQWDACLSIHVKLLLMASTSGRGFTCTCDTYLLFLYLLNIF